MSVHVAPLEMLATQTPFGKTMGLSEKRTTFESVAKLFLIVILLFPAAGLPPAAGGAKSHRTMLSPAELDVKTI